MQFDILTLFPGVLAPYLNESILGRAIKAGVLTVHVHQIRDFATDKHNTVDDIPYGGGAGMVMKCEPLYGAWEAAQNRVPGRRAKTILMSPQGTPMSQDVFENLTKGDRYILVCGRYEGVDERFVEECVDMEISLGDFVLSGGELPALALVDGIMRLLPGALGNESSLANESFTASHGARHLEYAHYTRPPEFHGRKVPEILVSGDHAKIAAWRRENAEARTKAKRPDLLGKHRKP